MPGVYLSSGVEIRPFGKLEMGKYNRHCNIFKIAESLKRQKFNSFNENLVIEDYLYGFSPLPEGWIWQDIGNYYGAACFGFNWRENQYDMILNPGERPGYPADVNTLKPFLYDVRIQNNIYTGKSGSGDNGYIYSSPFSNTIITKGTIPFQKEPFSISGSMPNPSNVFKNDLMQFLAKNNITFSGQSYSAIETVLNNTPVHKATHIIDSIFSPTLDSMNYWFLKKSINLYGEAFLKSLVRRKKGVDIGSNTYDTGISIIKNFWQRTFSRQPGNRPCTGHYNAVCPAAKLVPFFLLCIAGSQWH